MKELRFTNILLGALVILVALNLFAPALIPITVMAKGHDSKEETVEKLLKQIVDDGLKVKLAGKYGYEDPVIEVKIKN